MDQKCAPTKIFEDGSCIPLKLLVAMAYAYNELYPNDIIKLDTTLETLNPKKYKIYLVGQFQKRLGKVCDNQQCWIKQKFVNKIEKGLKSELLDNVFRPVGPEGQFTWLSTSDIDKVMAQYEEKYPDFKYLGTVPIDFDNLPYYGFDKLDFSKLHKIGVVFNLDRHDQPGSHWVALYGDIDKGEVYFFDSYGITPDKRIRALMRRIAKYIQDTGRKPRVDHNRYRHQFEGSECGVYSISFILRMLRGDSFQDVTKNIVKDRVINQCREYYFA